MIHLLRVYFILNLLDYFKDVGLAFLIAVSPDTKIYFLWVLVLIECGSDAQDRILRRFLDMGKHVCFG
jgi:hypothetical protein